MGLTRLFHEPPLALHLLLQRVEKAPVGALGKELLWRRLDHAGLVQAEGIEAYRILVVVLAPLAVGSSCMVCRA